MTSFDEWFIEGELRGMLRGEGRVWVRGDEGVD